MDQTEAIENAVDAADATAQDSTPETTETDATAASAEPGDTGEQDSTETPQDEAETGVEAPVDSSADSEQERNPIPYERFQQVNTQKNQYEGALQELLSDPASYREMFKAVHGRDPFDGASAGNTEQVDPTAKLLQEILPPEILELTEDDCATSTEALLLNGLKNLAKQSAELIGKQRSGEQQNVVAAQNAEKQQALTEFNSAVTEVEKALGKPLSQTEKVSFAKEISLFGDKLTVTDAAKRVRAHMFDLPNATQRGRDEAARILKEKERVAGARPASAGGGSGGGAVTGLSQRDAIAHACDQAGIR